MSSIFKIFGIFFLLLVFMAWYTLRLISQLEYSFGLTYLDLSKLGSIQSFAQGTSIVKVGLRMCIRNPLGYSIKLRNVKYQLYYQGTEVARSSDVNEHLREVNILASRETCFETGTDFVVNPSLLGLVLKLKKKEQTEIEYFIKGRFYFIPFTKRGTYKIN